MSELQQLLDRLVAAGAPGAAGWVRNERGSHGAASGLANRRTRQPMRPELRFRAGSMTKSLVAAVVLRLAAEGRLSLADPLERWLPGTLPYGDRVSLRQLLNHTGGVPHRTDTLVQEVYASRPGRLRTWTPQALVAMVADEPQAFPAGTTWSYSNTGYLLLGLVVEAASNGPSGRSSAGPSSRRSACSTPCSRTALQTSRGRARMATACRWAHTGRRSMAPCWTSPSRTPRGPERRARWCQRFPT